MKYSSEFLRGMINKIIPAQEVDEYIEDAKAGLGLLAEFDEATLNLATISQIMCMLPRLDRVEEMIELLLDTLKLTKNKSSKSNLYFGLLNLYYKLGYTGKVAEYALLFENSNSDNLRQSGMVYTYLSIILQETGFYELAYEYTEKYYHLLDKMELKNRELISAINYNNRVYILLKLNRIEEAKKYSKLMIELTEQHPDNEALQLSRPSFLFTKLFLEVAEKPMQSGDEYIKLMNGVFYNGAEKICVNKSIEPHLEMMKRIHDSKAADVFPVAYRILKDSSFVGERYSLSLFIIELYKEDNSILSDSEYADLLQECLGYAKTNVDNYHEVLHSLIGEAFRINEMQKQLADTKDIYEKDPLTNAYNRSHLEKVSDTYFKMHPNGSIVFADLNNFKSINDTYGHLAGDAALKRFAEIVNNSIPSDMDLYRFGGDEFILLSPYSYDKTNELLLYIKSVYKEEFVFKGNTINSDFSYGIEENNNMTFDELLHEVDTLMYQAKKE